MEIRVGGGLESSRWGTDIEKCQFDVTVGSRSAINDDILNLSQPCDDCLLENTDAEENRHGSADLQAQKSTVEGFELFTTYQSCKCSVLDCAIE